MNTNLKSALWFIAGVGVGALATYKYIEDKYARMFAEEEARYEEILEEQKFKDARFEEDEEPSEEKQERRRRFVAYDGKTPRTQYNTIFKTPLEGDDAARDKKEPILVPVPYIISIYEFNEDSDTQEKTTIFYYNEDGVLVDEKDEIITDPDDIIGEDTLLHFGDQSHDDNVVYIRNEKLSTDFEIIRLEKSYNETVLGIAEEPPRKKGKNGKKDTDES